MQLSETILNEIKNILSSNKLVEAAYLLGSAVEDRMRPDSDIDIALLITNSEILTPRELFLLASDLTVKAGRQVDLGLLNHQNLVYAAQTYSKGKMLFCNELGLKIVL